MAHEVMLNIWGRAINNRATKMVYSFPASVVGRSPPWLCCCNDPRAAPVCALALTAVFGLNVPCWTRREGIPAGRESFCRESTRLLLCLFWHYEGFNKRVMKSSLESPQGVNVVPWMGSMLRAAQSCKWDFSVGDWIVLFSSLVSGYSG